MQIRDLIMANAMLGSSGGGGGGEALDTLVKVLARDSAGIGATLTLPEEVKTLGYHSVGGFSEDVTTLVAPGVTTLKGNFAAGSYFTSFRFQNVTDVQENAFYDASSAFAVRFDALKTIGAVLTSSRVKKLILPAIESVTIVGFLGGCSDLQEVYFGPNCTSIANYAFGGAGSSGQTLTINCGFSEGTIPGTSWYGGAAGSVVVNYDVPIPT